MRKVSKKGSKNKFHVKSVAVCVYTFNMRQTIKKKSKNIYMSAHKRAKRGYMKQQHRRYKKEEI